MNFPTVCIQKLAICIYASQDRERQSPVTKGLGLETAHRGTNMTDDRGFERRTININSEHKCDAHTPALEVNYRVGAITKPGRIIGLVIVENAEGHSRRNVQNVEFLPSPSTDLMCRLSIQSERPILIRYSRSSSRS